MRLESVTIPSSSATIRGARPLRSTITIPSTLPILHSCASWICLSSTSRTSCMRLPSAAENLEWNRHQRQHERDQDQDDRDDIAGVSVAVFLQVRVVVHQDEQREHDER